MSFSDPIVKSDLPRDIKIKNKIQEKKRLIQIRKAKLIKQRKAQKIKDDKARERRLLIRSIRKDIKKPISKKKTKIKTMPIDKISRMIDKDLTESSMARKELFQALENQEVIFAKKLFSKSSNNVLDIRTGNDKAIFKSVLFSQQNKFDICRGIFDKRFISTQINFSNDILAIVDKQTIIGFLTYNNNRNSIKIPLICSKLFSRSGSKLLIILKRKFPSTINFRVDSIIHAVKFYKKQGFVIDVFSANKDPIIVPMIKIF